MKKSFLLSIFFLASFSIFAQSFQKFRQFNGRHHYIAIGNTLNPQENMPPNPCVMLSESSATLTLAPTQTLVYAMLYWSGSAQGDFDVKLNGNNISAQRTFSMVHMGLPYFAAFADVTSIVEAEGNGTYTFSDMDISATLQDYCPTGTNYGGWSIIVIYEDPSLLLNQVVLFDGLEGVSANNPILDITLDNIFAVSDQASKIGFVAWEGDASIANGESLFINNVQISNPPLNPAENAFNGTNSYTNSTNLYNMDLDFYSLEGIINPGDTSMAIQLTSQQDFIMVNNIITVVNSELPDPTIAIDDVTAYPQQNAIQITYTVGNTNSTAALPSNTPITFYADNVEFGTTQTNQMVPIGGSITEVATIALPIGTPSDFTLKATINADGTVPETDDTNNDYEMPIVITPIIVNQNPDALEVCDTDNDGFALFDLHQADIEITLGDPTLAITYHATIADAESNRNVLPNPYANTTPFNETVYARVINADGSSFAVVPLLLNVNNYPAITQPLDLFVNEGDGDGFAVFDLTENIDVMLTGLNPSDYQVSFYETQIDAQNDFNRILNPTSYQNLTNPQTVFVRVINLNSGCFITTFFEIETDHTVSVSTFAFTDLSISPNPTSDSFTVQSSQLVSETAISLYDIQGKLLLFETVLPQNGAITVDVSFLESGMYFLKISFLPEGTASEGNMIVKKLIKQ